MKNIELYKARWQAATKDIRENKPKNISISEYCKLIKKRREGDYLIKISKNNPWYGLGVNYIQFDYGLSDGQFALGRRSNAAWFTKEEAVEILNRFGKGFRMVKLSKNKK